MSWASIRTLMVAARTRTVGEATLVQTSALSTLIEEKKKILGGLKLHRLLYHRRNHRRMAVDRPSGGHTMADNSDLAVAIPILLGSLLLLSAVVLF